MNLAKCPRFFARVLLAGMAILATTRLHAQNAGEKQTTVWLEFRWGAIDSATAYRLQVSDRADFRNVIGETVVKQTSAIVELKRSERFYWRVAAVDEEGDLGRFSAVQVLHRPIEVPAPKPSRVPASVADKAALTPAPVAATQVVIPEPDRDRFFRGWVGYGASLWHHTVSGDGYLLQNRGWPLNRLGAGSVFDLRYSTVEWHGWLQPVSYQAAGPFASHSQWLWGTELFWSRLWRRWALPLGVGVRASQEVGVSQASVTEVGLASVPVASLLFGTNGIGQWGALPWSASLWLEVTPVGPRTGLGVIARHRVLLPWEWAGGRPSVELMARPFLRAFNGAQEWNFEAALSLQMDWSKPLPRLGQSPKAPLARP